MNIMKNDDFSTKFVHIEFICAKSSPQCSKVILRIKSRDHSKVSA
jgi:hypothetical protein